MSILRFSVHHPLVCFNNRPITPQISYILLVPFNCDQHLSLHKFLYNFLTTKSDILDKNLTENFGKFRILSIDGSGSSDGILAAKSLAHLETCLCRKSGRSDARITDFFDVGTGSGIGGILAALLFTKGKDGRPMFKASEALQFIVKNRHKLIPSSSKGVFGKIFSSSRRNKMFRKMFGESTLKDTLKPVLIPCYDLSTRASFLFSRTDAMENDSFNFKLSEVCAATSADPMICTFQMSSVDKKTRIVAVDGGVAMNNPTAAAITHVLNNKQEFPFCDSIEDLLVVSLGNGLSNASSALNYVKIGGEAASEMVDESVSMAFGGFVANNYVRVQAVGGSTGQGKNRLEIIETMLAQKSVESVLFREKKVADKTNSEKLESIAGDLIKEHERREMSILPTVMFKNSSPRSSSASISTVSSY
ncbi:hypothetical protein ACHQM5_018226 [Ranunculus cassubicifolius]